MTHYGTNLILPCSTCINNKHMIFFKTQPSTLADFRVPFKYFELVVRGLLQTDVELGGVEVVVFPLAKTLVAPIS